jgi:hypothetical protein
MWVLSVDGWRTKVYEAGGKDVNERKPFSLPEKAVLSYRESRFVS